MVNDYDFKPDGKESDGIKRFVDRLFPHIAHSTYISPVWDVWLAEARVSSRCLSRNSPNSAASSSPGRQGDDPGVPIWLPPRQTCTGRIG